MGTDPATTDRSGPDVPAQNPVGHDRVAATFRDADLERRFRDDGFVVVPFVDDSDLAALNELCDQHHSVRSRTWDCDFYSDDIVAKQHIADQMQRFLHPAIERTLTGHRSVLHSFVVNWPGPDGGLELHEHSAIVDQRRFRSVVVWCALGDASPENGTLHVVGRSHRLGGGPRPERGESWFVQHEDVLTERFLTPISVPAGSALIFDNALLHASFANSTAEPRRTAVATVIPNDAEFLYHDLIDDSTVRVYALDPGFFIEREPGNMEWAVPEGLPAVEEVAWYRPPVTLSDLDEVLMPAPTGPTQSH